MFDATDQLTAAGIRIIWLRDMDRRVLLVREARAVLADADLSREYVAHAGLTLWRALPELPHSPAA